MYSQESANRGEKIDDSYPFFLISQPSNLAMTREHSTASHVITWWDSEFAKASVLMPRFIDFYVALSYPAGNCFVIYMFDWESTVFGSEWLSNGWGWAGRQGLSLCTVGYILIRAPWWVQHPVSPWGNQWDSEEKAQRKRPDFYTANHHCVGDFPLTFLPLHMNVQSPS